MLYFFERKRILLSKKGLGELGMDFFERVEKERKNIEREKNKKMKEFVIKKNEFYYEYEVYFRRILR